MLLPFVIFAINVVSAFLYCILVNIILSCLCSFTLLHTKSHPVIQNAFRALQFMYPILTLFFMGVILLSILSRGLTMIFLIFIECVFLVAMGIQLILIVYPLIMSSSQSNPPRFWSDEHIYLMKFLVLSFLLNGIILFANLGIFIIAGICWVVWNVLGLWPNTLL